MKGKFYLVGLGLLADGVKFTPVEHATMNWLCSAAAESDAVFWDAVRSVPVYSPEWHAIEGLKKTFRALGKAPILQAHYDRAA